MTVHILVGDVLQRLRGMPSKSVHVVVTSPPYWGLRDYGTATWVGGDPTCIHAPANLRAGRDEDRAQLPGSRATNSNQLRIGHALDCACGAVKVDHQLGLEPTLGEHLDAMVEVFEEVKRVLADDGVLFVNYGDCYATAPNGRSAKDTKAAGKDDRTFRDKPFSTIGPIHPATGAEINRGKRKSNRGGQTDRWGGGNNPATGHLKAKDLCMVPNRFAIALQEAGWYVRSEIIWAKPNPMPESIKDRPATAHEKIFMFVKGRHYRYDADAVRQGRTDDEDANGFRGGSYVDHAPGPRKAKGNKKIRNPQPAGWNDGEGHHGSVHPEGRRPSTYRKPNAPDKIKSPHGQGFARHDGKRARSADVASPRHAGHVNHTSLEQVERGFSRNLRNYEPAPLEVWVMATRPFPDAHFATFPPELVERCLKMAGAQPGDHVLDPFGGAGTTALVADRMQLNATLIELSAEYAEMARVRIIKEQRLFADVFLIEGDAA